MSDVPQRRVAIIGGGLSGLATAAKLHRLDPSLELCLFERADRVGGVIHTERLNDFLIDHGADMFSIKPPAAIEFCQQLGLQDRLIDPQPTGQGARIVRDGNLIPIPNGFVVMRATQLLPMLTTPLLSIRGKLRFLLERWVKSPSEWTDESIAAFVRRRMGQEVLDRIVAPLSAGIYTADVTKLSMHATMRPVAELERKYGSLAKATAARRRSGDDSIERNSTGARYGQFRALKGGMIELIQTLAGSLPQNSIRLQSSVDAIVREGDAWHIHSHHGQETFDRVVVALPPAPASTLLTDLAPAAAAQLESMESASTAIVVIGVRRQDIERPVETFGFVVPLSEQRRILAVSFASHKFAGRAADDHALIRIFLGGAMQPELLQQSDDELVQIAQEELHDLIGLTGTPIVKRVVRWDDAMPQYHVGHGDRVQQIEDSIASVPGLFLVSNTLHGVGIAPVIKLADQIANDVIASFTPSSDSANHQSA